MKAVRDVKQSIVAFRRTTPTPEVTEEIGVNIDTVVLIALKILSRCRKSLKDRT